MKKFVSLLLVLTLIFSLTTVVFSEETVANQENFAKIKIPFPEEIELRDRWRTKARFKDSGQAITLSAYYEDYMFATVPVEDKNREIEVFIPDEIQFTDYNDENFEFYIMERLAKTGVILGNEKGEAKPFDNVTRAEAVAMVIRFLGLHTGEYKELPFEDVDRNEWFYQVVSKAYECGIVVGDSETTFSPNRNVTREEVTVMIARGLNYADLRCAEVEIHAKDIEEISDWAKDSYKTIGSCYASDPDITDPAQPERVLKPQKDATRYDVAYILDNCADLCQLYPSDIAVEFGFDKDMPVIDGSTSTFPFTQSVYTKLFANGMSHQKAPVKHSKSHVSYQRLINGEIDMIFASVYPASDILKMAEEKGVELELIPIAYDAMIFFTNMDNPAKGLTTEQITNIYVNNAYENWSEVGGSDALLYAYCRNNDSGSHAQMEKHFLKGNEIHPEVQKETSYTMSNVLTDVQGAKTEDPLGYGLGYSIYYYFHNMDLFYDTSKTLKLLEIDGVAPNDDTIASGEYPLSNNTYIVLRKDTPEGAPARKMAEFMLTEAGQQCVEIAGFGRLK